MKKLKVLVACEESQTVTKAFRKLGHEAYSCDLQPCSGGHPEWHIQEDALEVIKREWDLVIAHPTCTFLTNAGSKHLVRAGKRIDFQRWIDLEEAIKFFNAFKNANAKYICIENPIPHKHARDGFISNENKEIKGIGKYSQLIQPWHFGHKETKATCFWMYNLPNLTPTNIVGPPPKDKKEKKSWNRLHYLPPSADRAKLRSKTYQGIADAIAKQFSDYITNHN